MPTRLSFDLVLGLGFHFVWRKKIYKKIFRHWDLGTKLIFSSSKQGIHLFHVPSVKNGISVVQQRHKCPRCLSPPKRKKEKNERKIEAGKKEEKLKRKKDEKRRKKKRTLQKK